jgi:hypothetical protein
MLASIAHSSRSRFLSVTMRLIDDDDDDDNEEEEEDKDD